MTLLSRALQVACLFALLAASSSFADDIPWSYDGGEDGQDTWGTLSEAYVDCELGKAQSPIIIGQTEILVLPELDFRYHTSKAWARNSGRGVLVSFEEPQVLNYNHKEYLLKHIAIHSPGEHIVKNRAYKLEVQLMHLNSQQQKLIVAIPGDIGYRPPPPIQKMLDHFPRSPTEKPVQFTMNPGALLPKEKGYYTYEGSLTNPPCTEGVQWIVMKQKIGFSKEQETAITKLVGRNARLTQPVYFRTVKETAY